ncbi:MAG: hypothetical protein R3E86_18550 [Pseudomonadales bacterium]
MARQPEQSASGQPAAEPTAAERGFAERAVAQLYHSWITGLILALAARKGAATAEEFVFRLFRTQHLEKFLPGLDKLGLRGQPHAVAAAKYHYLSNQLGGVKVEYYEESPIKAWVRYPPPRWIWAGTAICGIPSEVNRAMLRGWHAHNGVSLGNPRLGFVCTGTTVDGQPGLEGYYLEHAQPLNEDQRLQFRPEQRCPAIDPAALPRLDAVDWPAERQAKAYRNYAMEYLRNGLPVLVSLLGPEEARYIGRIAALQIGMHGSDQLLAELGRAPTDTAGYLDVLQVVLEASGDQVVREDQALVQRDWRLFRGLQVHPVVRDIWLALLEGLLATQDRFLRLRAQASGHGGLRLTVARPDPD